MERFVEAKFCVEIWSEKSEKEGEKQKAKPMLALTGKAPSGKTCDSRDAVKEIGAIPSLTTFIADSNMPRPGS